MTIPARRLATSMAFVIPCVAAVFASGWESLGDGVDRSPIQVAVSSDGRWLFTANRTSNSVSRIDLNAGRVVNEWQAGAGPSAVCVSEDGRFVYVANRLDDTVTAIDTSSGNAIYTAPVANQPYDLCCAPAGVIYVACLGKDEVVQTLDARTGKVLQTVPVDENPRHLLLSSDGKRLYVTCDTYDTTRWLNVIDIASGKVVERVPFPMTSNLRDVAEIAPGVLMVTHLNPNPFTPLTQVQQGWANGNGFSFVFFDGTEPRQVMLLLDEFTTYYANPYGIAVTPDRRFAYVSCGGADEVVVIDLKKALQLVKETPAAKRPALRSRLSLSRRFITARIPVGVNPYGLEVSPKGERVFVANHLGNSVSVIETGSGEVTATIPVGSAPQMTELRRGEILFNSAAICFERQFACASCHPGGHTTGLSWDLEDDGLGNPKNIRSFRGVKGTGPFRWQGEAPEIGPNECGPTVSGGMRGQPLSPSDLQALATYVREMPLLPNPYRDAHGKISAAALRGKRIFEGAGGCTECHSSELLTSRERAEVGLGAGRPDTIEFEDGTTISPEEFDVPQLLGVWDSRPYLHDGRAKTLREVFSKFNPDDEHGSTSDLSEQELSDLVEYLKTL